MGRMAMPILLAQAVSPFIGNWLLEHFGPEATATTLVVAAALNVALVLPLLGFARRRPVPA
jgi:hypothetical protein